MPLGQSYCAVWSGLPVSPPRSTSKVAAPAPSPILPSPTNSVSESSDSISASELRCEVVSAAHAALIIKTINTKTIQEVFFHRDHISLLGCNLYRSLGDGHGIDPRRTNGIIFRMLLSFFPRDIDFIT